MIEILVAKVFITRNLAHLAHLKTKSYAQHMALGSFYDSIIDDIDAIVECYQGCFGLINIPELPSAKLPKDIVDYLEKEVVWIGANRKEIAQNVEAVENLLDNLSGTYFSTIYKLKNLS